MDGSMNDVSGIMHQIFMGQHRPLGFAGGAGGVDNQARIIRFNFNPGVFLRG